MLCFIISIFSSRSVIITFAPEVKVCIMYIRQGRYWKIANPRFLVARKGINMKWSITVFHLYLRKLSRNWDKFSTTALEVSRYQVIFYIKVFRTSAVLEKNVLNFGIISYISIKKCITTSHFYVISCDQKLRITNLRRKKPIWPWGYLILS